MVLLTFIYTRCPLADYLPADEQELRGDRQGAGRRIRRCIGETHLLSISFDPKYDTPAVLKSYGGVYTGGDAKEFAHWEFAAPPEDELSAMEQFFDLGVTPGEAGTLTHSLSTARDWQGWQGAAWYPTNEWTPAEVLAAMKSAAAA